jgi:hypothetical protein
MPYDNLPETKTKLSYAISCSSQFRNAAMALAERRGVNVGDLARSTLLTIPADVIERLADPGEPLAEDREAITLKSSRNRGKLWRRKPRLQVRLPPGYDAGTIRRALGLALALDSGAKAVTIEDNRKPTIRDCLKAAEEEVLRLRTIVEALAFVPLPEGVKNRSDALHVLGFSHDRVPEHTAIRARYRTLASIHHPDSGFGDHRRMSQLNEAMNHLRSSVG